MMMMTSVKYLFYELIRNIGVSYHVAESVSFNGKRIAMVKNEGLDLIYRGVHSRQFTRAEVVMLCQLSPILLTCVTFLE